MKRLGDGSEQIALLARDHVEEARLRTERRRHPICRARSTRADHFPLLILSSDGKRRGTPIGTNFLCPCHPAELFREDKFPVGAIQQIKKTVAIGMCKQFSRLAIQLQIQKNWDFGRIPIMGISRCELEVPFQFSSICIQGKHAIRVEIVSPTPRKIVRRRRITRGPVDKVQFGVERPRQPSRSASSFPRVPRPRFISGLVRAWYRVETPCALSRLCVVCVNESANPIFPTRNSDYDFIFHCKWS